MGSLEKQKRPNPSPLPGERQCDLKPQKVKCPSDREPQQNIKTINCACKGSGRGRVGGECERERHPASIYQLGSQGRHTARCCLFSRLWRRCQFVPAHHRTTIQCLCDTRPPTPTYCKQAEKLCYCTADCYITTHEMEKVVESIYLEESPELNKLTYGYLLILKVFNKPFFSLF